MCDEQKPVFENKEVKIKRSIDFLKSEGYRVIRGLPLVPGGNSKESVYTFFKSKVIKLHPAVHSNSRYTKKEELSMVGLYIKIRVQAGLTKPQAYAELYRLIDRVFEREPYLNLKSPIIDFSFFIAKGTKFMISRFLEDIHNEYKDVMSVAYAKEAGKKYAKENIDLDETSKELEGLLKGFEEKK